MMNTIAINNSKGNNKQDLDDMSVDELLAEAIERLQKIEEIIQGLIKVK